MSKLISLITIRINTEKHSFGSWLPPTTFPQKRYCVVDVMKWYRNLHGVLHSVERLNHDPELAELDREVPHKRRHPHHDHLWKVPW